MDSRILHAIIFATILSPAAFGEEKDPRVECAVAAMLEYSKANLAKFNAAAANPNEFISVESTIAHRRHEENHCLKMARCLTDGSSLALGAFFSGCLRDVAAEK